MTTGTRAREWLAAVVVVSLASSAPWALGQEAEREGDLTLREAYLAARRQGPDRSFDVARARLQAVRQMRAQALVSAPDSTNGAPVANPLVWENIGPGPINNGQTPLDNSYRSDVSGRVTAIAIDPIDSSIYVGTAQGGLWKSQDNGASWIPLTDSLASLAVGSIAVDPALHSAGHATVYVGTGEGNGSGDSYGGVGVYKSTDSGATWTGPYESLTFTHQSMGSIVVDRVDPSHLLAATTTGAAGISFGGLYVPPYGIWESVNGGVSWTHKDTAGTGSASMVLQDPIVTTTWWGALSDIGGLVKSVDNGATWTELAGTGGLPALSPAWGRGAITGTVNAPSTASALYLATELATAKGTGKVYRSIDGGANWTPVAGADGYCNGQCWYDDPVYVEPGAQDTVYVGGGARSFGLPTAFMRSDNGGATFADKAGHLAPGLHADIHAITTWPGQPAQLWVGTDGGVWRSTDRGESWVNVNSNLAITQFMACDLHPGDPAVAYGGTQDNGTNGWQGPNNWTHQDDGDGGHVAIDRNQPSHLVHTYYNFRNSQIGVAFTTSGFGGPGGYQGSFAPGNGISLSDRVLFYAPIHLDRGLSSTLYFGTNRLWRATSFFATGGTGGEFQAVNAAQDLTGGAVGDAFGGAISAIATLANPTAGLSADLVYVGSSNGSVYRTTNATTAATWTAVDFPGGFVSDVVIDPANSQIVYTAVSRYAGVAGQNIRKSTDGGATWNYAATGLPDVPVNSLVLDPITPNKVWAGTDIGVYVSPDAGGSWAPMSPGLPSVAVFDLKANAATRQILACTHGRSAYMMSIDDDLIFRDGVESRDFSRWSATVNNGGLAVAASAAMGGTTTGIRATANGALPQSVQDDSPHGETRYRARFYFNPNSFDTGEAQNHHRTRLFIAFNGSGQRTVAIVLRRVGGAFAIEGRVRQSDGSRVDSGFVGLTNAPHFIEFDWARSAAGQSSGTFTLYIDGVAQPVTSGIANETETVEAGRLGALSTKAGATGSMFFDQFESRRQNYCGPVV